MIYGPQRPQPSDSQKVPYPDIRDRFLSKLDSEDLIETYVAVGYFVVDRWVAEELTREEGQAVDEVACMPLWDEWTEKRLRDTRAEAQVMLSNRARDIKARTLLAEWQRRAEPIRGILSVVRWCFMEALRGFVGALGILLFGLIVVWTFPHIAKVIRSTADDALPVDTRPQTLNLM